MKQFSLKERNNLTLGSSNDASDVEIEPDSETEDNKSEDGVTKNSNSDRKLEIEIEIFRQSGTPVHHT